MYLYCMSLVFSLLYFYCKLLPPLLKRWTNLIVDMNTFSNANTRRGGIKPLHTGFTPNVSLKPQSSQTRVSVRHAQDPNKQWFVLRAIYSRESKAYDFIIKDKTEAFIKNTHELSFLNYYYDHFQIEKDGKNSPFTISYREMMNFIHVANVNDDHIMVVEPQHCHFKDGGRVKIVKGKFREL